MNAVISSFRGSLHRRSPNQMVVVVEGVESKENAAKLVGKKVTFVTEAKKEIVGKVSGFHGNSGAVRVIFTQGMPGQALGKPVKIE